MRQRDNVMHLLPYVLAAAIGLSGDSAFARGAPQSIVGRDRPPASPDLFASTEVLRSGDVPPFKPAGGGSAAAGSGQAAQKNAALRALQRPNGLTWLPDDQREPLLLFSSRFPGAPK